MPALLARSNNLSMLPHSADPLPDIRLHQPDRLLSIAQPLFLPPFSLPLTQLAQGQEPGVDDAEPGVAERGVDAAAGGVAAHDDVLDFEVRDGVGDYGLGGEVRGREHVGDVTVDEDVAGLEA